MDMIYKAAICCTKKEKNGQKGQGNLNNTSDFAQTEIAQAFFNGVQMLSWGKNMAD